MGSSNKKSNNNNMETTNKYNETGHIEEHLECLWVKYHKCFSLIFE